MHIERITRVFDLNLGDADPGVLLSGINGVNDGASDPEFSADGTFVYARNRFGVGDRTVARELLRRALTHDDVLAPREPELATALAQLGMIELERGELAEASELLERAVELFRNVDGEGEIAANLGIASVIQLNPMFGIRYGANDYISNFRDEGIVNHVYVHVGAEVTF